MRFLLDTNILIGLLRQNKSILEQVDDIGIFDDQNRVGISIVTVGELQSFSLKNGWGERKRERLEDLLLYYDVYPINGKGLTKRYAQIEAYSQGKLALNNQYLKGTARNMGKNDLWIAATASLTQSTLLTMDYDFRHLEGSFLEMETLEF